VKTVKFLLLISSIPSTEMEQLLNIRTYPAYSGPEQHFSRRRRNIQTSGGRRTTCLPLLELL